MWFENLGNKKPMVIQKNELEISPNNNIDLVKKMCN